MGIFIFIVFILAALLTFVGLKFRLLERFQGKFPRPNGVVFVGAVLITTALGWIFIASVSLDFFEGLTPPNLLDGIGWITLTAALYFLTALRRKLHLPVWVNDIFILAAAAGSIYFFGTTVISVISAPESGALDLGHWSIPTTLLWVWVVSRLTAALNRTPRVTGGHLGLVALTILIVLDIHVHDAQTLPFVGAAALAGAGLVTIPFAIKQDRDFNIGWSAALAMGFFLAQITTIGLQKKVVLALLLFSVIVLGLPILDSIIYRIRSNKSTFGAQRFHENLLRRGLTPLKIGVLYLTVGAWICAMGILASRFVFRSLAWWQIAWRSVAILLIFLIGLLLFVSLFRILMRRTEDEDLPEYVEAFGVRVSVVSMKEALEKIDSFVASGKPHHVATSDANGMLCAQKDQEYADIIGRAALVTPDGYGVVWGMRLLNMPIYERVTGVDMVTGICEIAAQKGYSIYILGSNPGVAATAAEKLQERYPGLRVAGTQHGYYERDGISEETVVQRIHDAKPDILFVAFGIPKQEKFIARNLDKMQVPVSVGVGGSFDVYSENLRRAPVLVQHSGLEWAYRVWQEPWRWKRMSYVPRFMVLAIRTWIFGNRHSNKSPSI